MKQNLRVGEGYAPAQSNLNQRYIRYISLLAVLTTMCLYAVKQVSAQQAEPAATAVADIKPLQIGDTIPEYLWHLPLQVVNHPEGKEKITLNEYRGKLIILDFWATWCGSCIAGMPKADDHIRNNRDKLMVFPVSTEALDKVSSFWLKNKTTKSLDLLPVGDAHVLKHVFPHKIIPHLVWIAPEGTVSAFTSSTQLNQSQLTAALKGDFSIFREKINVDMNRPLFTTEHLPIENLQYFALLFRGRLEGLGSGNILRRTDGIVHGRALSNKPLLTLFEICARELMVDYSQDRLIYDTNQRGGLLPEFSDLPLIDWNDSLLYTVEVRVPVADSERLYPEMLETLNQNTAYNAGIISLNKRCYVLKEISSPKRRQAKGGANPQIAAAISKLSWTTVPVVDETNKTLTITADIITTASASDMQSLRRVLFTKGIRIAEEQRELDFLVIRDNSTH